MGGTNIDDAGHLLVQGEPKGRSDPRTVLLLTLVPRR